MSSIQATPAAHPALPFLVGESVILRPLVESDADGPYVSWFNDPEVCRYNGHHAYPYTRDDALDYIRSLKSKPDLVLAIATPDGRHVGNVSLQDMNLRHRTAAYAVVLGDRDVWGRGVAYEASRMILHHGFTALNLHRVSAGTTADNEAMRRLALRLGMREEGVRREAVFKDGRYRDVVEYGLLASEWSDRSA